MRLGIKGKQVLGVTSIVAAVVVVLSLLHLANLARVSLQESKARAELLAFPLLFLLGFSMHGSTYKHLAGRGARHRRAEIALLVAHNLLYFGLLLAVLGNRQRSRQRRAASQPGVRP